MKVKDTIISLMMLLTATAVQGQITIGGNVYGGGNAGKTGGSTTVTVCGGDIGAVYGGARMANVDGSSFVNIDGANASEDILIANVYGGNDISGTIGQSNVATTVPTVLDEAGANAIDNSWKTFIRTSPSVKYTPPIEGFTGVVDKYMVVVGTLYGGGNGDYVYKDGSGNNLTDGNGNFIVRDATGATVATSSSAFSKPELSKTYLELKGGCIAHVYGGGNAATVTNNTTIHIENSSDDLEKAATVWAAVKHSGESMTDVFNYLQTKTNISIFQSDVSSFALNFARVFGGNNKAPMAIRPTWNLKKGIIRDLYSGGNEGKMTNEKGIFLPVNSPDLTVHNVYGGCRRADVDPSATSIAEEIFTIGGKNYTFPEGYAARVLITAGNIDNVYGGNDISGTVKFGNAIGIRSRINGDVYGGGNGSYVYTDNADLANDTDYADFYYNPGSNSAEALNAFRPNAESVSIHIEGNSDTDMAVIGGSVYCGGNSATLNITAEDTSKKAELKLGKFVIADKVFLGSNGEHMIEPGMIGAYRNNKKTIKKMVNDVETDVVCNISTLDLTDPTVFATYMKGVDVGIRPTVAFDSDVNYNTYIGSYYCGGNVGSMSANGLFQLNFNKPIIIYNKVVGGCNSANVDATNDNAAYAGGLTGNPDDNGNKVELNFAGLKIQPRRWNADKTALVWNTVKVDTDEEDNPTSELPLGALTDADKDRRLLGGNVYGGCYNSGRVNGNVVININGSLVDLEGDFAVFDETQENEAGVVAITKRHSGVTLDTQGDDVLGKAMNVFGGGYGPESEIWGSTTINVKAGYAFQVFGGGEQGPIGKPNDGEGNDYTYKYKKNGVEKTQTYKYNPKYSCYVNLRGNYEGVNKGHTNDQPDMAEVEYLYGGAFEAPIAGNVVVSLGNGRIYQSFGGSCNADILGHTETYVGRQAKDDGTFTDGGGFPWVRDNTYGGNDMGGHILNSADFKARVSNDVLGKVHGYTQTSTTSDVLQAAAYTEFIQGRVINMFGGAYGVYDYTDPHFKDYTYTRTGKGTTDDPYVYPDDGSTEANVGKEKDGFSKPFADNAFINFKPNSNARNAVTKVFGGPEGSEGEINKDLMQQRSYVLIDAPDVSNYQTMEVFGAGLFGGLGMNKTKADAKANLDKVSAIIDLMRGKIANVYGGSRNQGMTRRTLVNVPTGSTISVDSLFGGGFGSDPLIPCDVYEAKVNYHSEDATVRGNIYGGNNFADRTLYGQVNITVPVWQNKADGYLATVYGAGHGEESWSQYTEVNLTGRAQVYNVFGGGEDGQVLNLETINQWKVDDPTLDLTLGSDYEDKGLFDKEADKNDPDAYLVKTNGLGTKTNTNVYIGKGALVGYVSYKDDAQHPDGRQKNIYGGYAFGGGYGSKAIVSGTTYVGLHGGEIGKDVYGGGYGGSVLDDRGTKQFIAQTNAYIEGGTLRKVFGGGYEGHVGKHTGAEVDGKFFAVAGSVMGDIPGETNVVIGIRKDQVFPEGYVFDNAGNGDSLNYYKGIPAIQWNAYGAGEGGSVFGTTHLTMNNGYIGYEYNGIVSGKEVYLPKFNNETVAGTGGVGQLKDYGSVFGAGYDDKSSADFTDIKIYGGVIRGSLYGGGEIATVGRGRTGVLTGLDRDVQEIYLTGGTRIEMYNGHVMRHVFGGGKGYNLYGYGGSNELYTDGYVFGKTEVHIHGGEVGTAEGLAEGYGNVFGGGDVGFVYGAGYFDQYTATEKNNVKGTTGSPNHWYYYASYKCNSNYGPYKVDDVISNVAFNTMSDEEKAHWTPGKYLTEDCKVVVAPMLQVKPGKSASYDNVNYGPYEYVPTDYLNTLPKEKTNVGWANLYTGDRNADGSINPDDPVERGVQIRNAVFAGGNVSSNNDKTYANATTVFGNTTATLYDVYHRDFITVGTEHTGGLYGGGNLSMVDGYRELNITNYGTDYYGLDQKISYEEYQKLSNRERAYFQLKYTCITAYKSGNGTDYTVDYQLTEEEYNELINTYPDEASKWTQYGFCSIYAGRLLNTIQRADLCGVFGSRMVLQGAKDRIAGGDNTPYTINRIGELSLNKQRFNPASDSEIHGNYFGIYSVVNYLGNLTSDVHFDDPYYKYDADHDTKELVSGKTYYSNKVENLGNRNRNNGTAENQVALASGVFLELTTENSTQTKKDYGYVTGIVELDLINVKKDIEGGGYVYAKNEHRIPKRYPNKENVILSEYNKQTGNEACTYKQFRYSTSDDGIWVEDEDVYILDSSHSLGDLVTWQTSGNFIHKKKPIVDDCYPNNGIYNNNDVSPAHYWYIKGTVYVYDQVISAYAGAASTYSKEVKIPLTITAGSNGRLKLLNVQPNFYAYYTDNNGTRVKLGTPDANNKPIDKVTVNNEMDTYKMNDVITWWDWNMLTETDQQYFVKETYVNVDTCTVNGVSYPEGTYVMLPSDSIAFKTDYINTNLVFDKKGNKVTKFYELFHPSNNIGHDTGYVLTFDIDSPKDWDDWYSPIKNTDGDKISKETYKGLSTTDKEKYREGPTYTLKGTENSALYGQRSYEVSEIIPKEVYDDYTTTVSKMSTQPTGQAVVEEAYVALVDMDNVQAGSAVPKSSVAANDTRFDVALVCVNTIQYGEEDYIVAGDLVPEGKKAELASKYKTYIERQINLDDVTDAEALQYIEDHLTKAYYCKTAGLYGGQYFERGTNYGALKAWCALTDDRDKFDYNYDAFDVLVDPDYHGENHTETYYKRPYSDTKPVEYEATYTGSGTLNYKYKDGTDGTISNGGKLSRDLFEQIENEQSHYSRIEVAENGQTVHIAKETFIDLGSPYAEGRVISEKDYKALTQAGKAKVENVYFANSSSTEKKTVYYCYDAYSPITQVTPESGTLGAKGSVISQTDFKNLKNFQKEFVVHGSEPTETTTLYVSRESNAKDVTSEKVISVVYQYTYYEDDDEGDGVNMVNELHVVNIHLQLESGVPEVGTLSTPSTILPGTKLALKAPTVNPGFYEIITNGWELYTNETDAENHRNGVPFTNNGTPFYWYQNQKAWVAFYSKTYLGKTYSNSVRLSVANYHDLDAVMKDKEHHLYVDHPDVMRNSKIYIDNRTCESDPTKSELDLLKDFFDLSMLSNSPAEGSALAGHANLNSYVAGGANLEFILNSDVFPKKYIDWTPIGSDEAGCFAGNLHGDGYTISGLNNSLFGKLCGNVYNLGVTGSFTSAGIVDTGEGYVENCWINTTGAPTGSVRAVFGNPTRGSQKQIVNCYYPKTKTYSTNNNGRGLATPMSETEFYNGTVAYNLNGFYLNKRYYDNKQNGGASYQYLTSTNGTLSENMLTGYYPSDYAFYPLDAKKGGSDKYGYVEDRYIDGDFVYAGGKVPDTSDDRMRVVTEGNNATVTYAPIWPDDYIYFGQMLTYGYNSSRPHQDEPAHIVKSSGRLQATDLSNRVYRAPAYYRSSEQGVAHYNLSAYLAAQSTEQKDAYPNMTAIDFAGHYDDTWTLGLSGKRFYPPLLDNEDGLLSIDNEGETHNLLVYAPSAGVNQETYDVLAGYFVEPAYSSYYTGDAYRRVDIAPTLSIHGHLVQSNLEATCDHLLVDKQDFNAPIAYSFDDSHRMWYQRTPDRYVDTEKGWESVSLPFTAELVTTHQKGEITHFYSGSKSIDENGTKIGHEYWLREMNGLNTTDPATALFNYPNATGTEAKTVTNTFLWDYYYQDQTVHTDRSDANDDKYQQFYNSARTYSAYPNVQKGAPYLIGFPGTTYYEFDLSGNFIAKNTASPAPAQLERQVITFASRSGETVGVSDTELESGAAGPYSGYYFKPNYLNIEVPTNGYLMAADGGSYVKVDDTTADKRLSPFRCYFQTGNAVTRSIRFSNIGSQMGGDDEGDDHLVQSMEFSVKKHAIVVTSHMQNVADVGIYSASGICIGTFDIQPGETIETPIYNSGVYIIRAAGGHYTHKVTIK